MADNDSSRQIPERWKLVIKEQKDGSCISYYTCPESGQKFSTYEDLMRYVNYAKAAKLSIYSPDFRPRNTPRGPKKKASKSVEEQTEGSSDSDDSMFKLPSIASLELPEVAIPTPSDQQSSSGQMKTKNRPANEGCSSGSNKGKGKKQKM
ncbi:hypothetical protein PTKIN_Ptkin15bG0035200 [Pterospermum kingtungense]